MPRVLRCLRITAIIFVLAGCDRRLIYESRPSAPTPETPATAVQALNDSEQRLMSRIYQETGGNRRRDLCGAYFRMLSRQIAATPDAETRDAVKTRALDLFMATVADLMDPSPGLAPAGPGPVLADLAVTLDAKSADAGESVYDMIFDALAYRHDVSHRHGTPPPWAQSVLRWGRTAEELMQRRHNALTSLILNKFTSFNLAGVRSLKARMIGTSADLDGLPAETLAMYGEWINKALRTRDQLKSLHIQPEFDSGSLQAIRNTEFTSVTGMPDRLRFIRLAHELGNP